jgi:hypothetical protein
VFSPFFIYIIVLNSCIEMKNLTLKKNWPIGFIVLFCLAVSLSCRKDRSAPLISPHVQLIKQEKILQWVEDNPVAKLLTLDWKNAKQAVVDGRSIVRVPTLNMTTDAATTGLVPKQLLNGGEITANRKLSAVASSSPTNPNYFNQHPPELFFVQGNGDEKVRGALLNFVPTSPNVDFGENGIWTGKLYSWNLNGDTVCVQEIVKSKLQDRYGLKQRTNEQSNLAVLVPKNSRLANIDNSISCCFFEWLAVKLGNLVGWLGSIMGLPTYDFLSEFGGGLRIAWGAMGSSTDPMSIEPTTDEGISGSYIVGYGQSFDFENFPSGGPNDSGSAFIPASLVYLIQNLPNLSDADKNWLAQRPPVAEEFAKYLEANGLSNENIDFVMWIKSYLDARIIYDIGMPGSMEKLYLVKNLNLTEEQDVFIHARTAIAKELAGYLRTKGNNEENRDFLKWAVAYLQANPEITAEEFRREYLEVNFDNPLQGENISLVNNGIGVTDVITDLPPVRQIASTLNRGNVEDLTFGTNHDATGVKGNFLTKSDPDLYTDMASVLRKGTVFDSEAQQVAIRFLDIFYLTNNSNQNVYSDPILNLKVSENGKFIDFMKRFGDIFRSELQLKNGDVDAMSNIDLQNRPIFDGAYNMSHGLTILLNDTEQTKINLVKFTLSPNGSWVADFEVVITDHFGLDRNDVLSKQHISDGFPAWWVLQHRRGKVPFITKVTVKKRLTGNIN